MICIVNLSILDGIGHDRIADVFMPVSQMKVFGFKSNELPTIYMFKLWPRVFCPNFKFTTSSTCEHVIDPSSLVTRIFTGT